MEKKIICTDAELATAHEKFCTRMFDAQDDLTISAQMYELILSDADAEYNKMVYGE